MFSINKPKKSTTFFKKCLEHYNAIMEWLSSLLTYSIFLDISVKHNMVTTNPTFLLVWTHVLRFSNELSPGFSSHSYSYRHKHWLYYIKIPSLWKEWAIVHNFVDIHLNKEYTIFYILVSISSFNLIHIFENYG